MIRGRLVPLLEGVRVRQALSRTAVAQALLSRPGGDAARPHPDRGGSFNPRTAALLTAGDGSARTSL